MNKNAIKKYAARARRELLERVARRAMLYGVTADKIIDPAADNVNGRLLSASEKRQRQALIRHVERRGFAQVIEEVAYTWFNRFAALRFMEVNGYLPTRVRVFSNDADEFKPQILAEAMHLDLDGLDIKKIHELESAGNSEELFKYLLIVQCNALKKILPGIFHPIEDYTELLLPDNLLREGNVLEQLVTAIPTDDWTDQVQIIGWLYQYYNAEPKSKVFANLKRNIKICKENLPAATQLFTPDWIVCYMVENSLGRLWLENHPNAALKAKWKYYIDGDTQPPAQKIQSPEDIRVIDPCAGSGHVLCALFDVLVGIYEACGYSAREAAAKIVAENLWGVDVDERAAQLANFAVMMTARRYDRQFFSRNIQPNVFALRETDDLRGVKVPAEHQTTFNYLLNTFADAKEVGSLIRPAAKNYRALLTADVAQNLWHTADDVKQLIWQAIVLEQKYHVVVTNPPYMSVANMSPKLASFVKKNFPDGKGDLFACFIERCAEMTEPNCFMAMITQHAWMFLGGFERLRVKFMRRDTLINMIHLGARAFEDIGGEVVQTVGFVLRRGRIPDNQTVCVRLVEPDTQRGKELMFLSGANRFTIRQEDFTKVPSTQLAYQIGKPMLDAFDGGRPLSDFADVKQGIATADNNRFLRLWHECNLTDEFFDCQSHAESANSSAKWYPYAKGGEFRKWYGNLDYVVNWQRDGRDLRAFKKAVLRNPNYYFRECVGWNKITSGAAAFRYRQAGTLFDVAELSMFTERHEDLLYLLALCNSVYAQKLLEIISPTLNCEIGHVASIPVLVDERKPEVIRLAKENISLARADWDAFETSRDFAEHPFITAARTLNKPVTLNEIFAKWQKISDERFRTLKANEETLNRIFIETYNLGDELTAEVDDKAVTVRRADFQRDVRNFISYAVGCMFGRYTLQKSDSAFAPVSGGIIPVTDEEYFANDIVTQFVAFTAAALGQDTLTENLRLTAQAIGKSGSPHEVIRNYFLNDFYTDHLKTYRKRPIYWLFDSGRRNGFKALIYMHSYRSDTIARLRTDYVHEQQARHRTAIEDLQKRIDGAATIDRVKLSKRLNALQGQAEELRAFEEKIHHLADKMITIDLDDGVKKNYGLFGDVLAEIR